MCPYTTQSLLRMCARTVLMCQYTDTTRTCSAWLLRDACDDLRDIPDRALEGLHVESSSFFPSFSSTKDSSSSADMTLLWCDGERTRCGSARLLTEWSV